jgi:hypothetical protein
MPLFSRKRRPEPKTVRDSITSTRNHLLYSEMELAALKGRSDFFATRYEQVKEMRMEFEAFPPGYGGFEPA